MRFAVRVGAICLGTVAFVVAAGAAEDSKVYSAAFCRGLDGGDDFVFQQGALVAQGSGTYTCPLIRDNVGAANNLGAVWVELFHASSTSTTCTLSTQVEDQAADILDQEVVRVPATGSASGFQQASFSAMQTSDGNEGGYSVSCNLSNGTALRQITVRED